MSPDHEGWAESQMYIVKELERLNKNDDEFRINFVKLIKEFEVVKYQNKSQSAIWSGLVGAGVSIIVSLIVWLVTK